MKAEEAKAAHEHCGQHKQDILASDLCACFCCLDTFPPSEIEDWIDGDQTAICPRCAVDSVIGSASGYELTDEFLKGMYNYFFEPTHE